MLLLVHGIAYECIACLASGTFYVNANRLVGNGTKYGCVAMADVEMYVWIFGQCRFSVFAYYERRAVVYAIFLFQGAAQ